LWLHGQLPEAKQASFAELLEINLKTARAWAYKEQFVEFWGQPDAAQGFDFFTRWKRSVMRSRLTKVKAVAKTLHQHLTNLLTYFMHPSTNAVSENFNSPHPGHQSRRPGLPRLPQLSLSDTFSLW
jgi:transposase